MTVTVLITLLEDARVLATIQSLAVQTRRPDQVLVADGGSSSALLDRIGATHCPGLEVLHAPGSVAETRADAMDAVKGDVVVFLDADETAPPDWLAALVAPIEAGHADVTGGPTRPMQAPRSRAEAYVNDFDAWFYDEIVAQDAASLPMGNSAWRTALIRAAGGFDARLAWGGEDYDVNLRARAAGARFQYVPDAWVLHDQSHLDSFRKVWRRMRRYAKGATVAYRKNDALRERAGNAVSASRFQHPYQPLLVVAKGIGFLQGTLAWRRLQRRDDTG